MDVELLDIYKPTGCEPFFRTAEAAFLRNSAMVECLVVSCSEQGSWRRGVTASASLRCKLKQRDMQHFDKHVMVISLTVDYCRLRQITGDYLSSLEITGDYWTLTVQVSGQYILAL